MAECTRVGDLEHLQFTLRERRGGEGEAMCDFKPVGGREGGKRRLYIATQCQGTGAISSEFSL